MRNVTKSSLSLVLLLASLGFAQLPSSRPADPGPLVTDPATGLQLATGYRAALLFNVLGAVPAPADMIVSPQGDIYLSQSSGSGCGPSSSAHLQQVLMQGDSPRAPLTFQQWTQTPIDGHVLAVEPTTGYLFATGTCDQTSFVYRLPPHGIPEIMNSATPLPDPDGLVIGSIPGTTDPKLFVACQDSLYIFGNLTSLTPSLTIIPVDVSALGIPALGNWGSLSFDAGTGTLLASNVGAPSTFLTVEISFNLTPAIVATASLVSNSSGRFVGRDDRGARLVARNGQLGYLNAGVPSPTFVPFAAGFGANPIVRPYGVNGAAFVLDPGTGNLYRLEPSLRVNRLDVSATAGSVTTFSLRAASPHANEPFLILVGVSGASPGFSMNNVLIPLNYDQLSLFAFDLAIQGHPALLNWNGMLDSTGSATANLFLGSSAALPNFTLNFCFVTGIPDSASNAAWIHVLP